MVVELMVAEEVGEVELVFTGSKNPLSTTDTKANLEIPAGKGE